MRKIVLTLASLAAIGLVVPLTSSAKAEEGVSVRIGEREHHRDRDWNRGHRKVVIVKERRHERWRDHRGEGKVIIRRGDRD